MSKLKPVAAPIEDDPIDLDEIERVNSDPEFEPIEREKPVSFERTLSTGSTLLDLAISGERIRGGGVPGGIFMEIFGPESVGKTAILAEIISGAQRRKPPGEASLQDPEGRFSEEHARIYGVDLPACDYARPDTVEELFAKYSKWKPKGKGIHVFGTDSLAALSTKMEMGEEDKMGMRRAKMFSEGLRKHGRRVANEEHLFAMSNQVRDDAGNPRPGPPITPGGRAIRFYSSLRLELKRAYPAWRIERKADMPSGKEDKQQVGIISEVRVIKNSIAHGYRTALIYILLGYGLDDVRANLQWYKNITGNATYGFDKSTSSVSLEGAIQKVEGDEQDPNTWKDSELRDQVIDLWLEVQELFKVDRRPKQR